MLRKRVLVHLVLSTLTWSALWGLLATLRPERSEPMLVMAEPTQVYSDVPADPPTPSPGQSPVLSPAELRAKERILSTSADYKSIVNATFSLYRHYFCRLGEDSTHSKLKALLSRNRRVVQVDVNHGSLTFQMKNGMGGTLLLHTGAPDCP